ncbi:MAG TPA: class IV adenylate cyclase [Bryobacteraceae bacterium]|nr:class IV adenylate cyclase [Bryobacteraceae bacterium]
MSSPSDLEIEVKIPYADGAEAARRLIESRGLVVKAPRSFEANTLFDRESRELRHAGQLLRLRRVGNLSRVTYKGPALGGRYKSREEIEFDVSNPDRFAQVLERLGYSPGLRYEKFRTTFAVPGEPGEVTLDETPIGVFLELEGDPEWIDRTAARLGFSAAEYVTRSYAVLYEQYRAKHPDAPENMIFDSAGS